MSLLDDAKNVKIHPFAYTTLGRLSNNGVVPKSADQYILPVAINIPNVDIEDMLTIINYFNINSENLVEDDLSDKIKYIYEFYRDNSEETDIYLFLKKTGLKIGGQARDNLFDKFFTYLRLVQEEITLKDKLQISKAEINNFKKNA